MFNPKQLCLFAELLHFEKNTVQAAKDGTQLKV